MTVAQLITLLQRCDPSAPVLVAGSNGTLTDIGQALTQEAVLDGDGEWHEPGPDAPEGRVVSVVVVV